MGTRDEKWIRSIKDNPAGKVVADPSGNRFEWDASEEGTSRLLRKLENDELSIEQTNVGPAGAKSTAPAAGRARKETAPPASPRKSTSGGRDAGGGFNPYDNSGKRPRR